MQTPIDEMSWPLTCPQCGHQFEKTLGWLEAHREFPCPTGCGQGFALKGDDIGQAKQALLKLREQLGKLSKPFK